MMMTATPEVRAPRAQRSQASSSPIFGRRRRHCNSRWEAAVQDLCKALVASRPNLEVTVFETARPWFRFGNGRWGRALYKVSLKDATTGITMSIYALPAVGVPVLTGMKELQNLQCIINCTTGACVIRGQPMQLQKNHKEHLIIDYKEHIFPETTTGPHHTEPNAVKTPSSCSTSSKPSRRVSFSEIEECHVLDIFTLDFMDDDMEIMTLEESDCFCNFVPDASQHLARHLGVTDMSLQHLMTTADDRQQCPSSSPSFEPWRTHPSRKRSGRP